MKRPRPALALVVVAALLAVSAPASADPSVWSRAADPALEHRAEVETRVNRLMGDYYRTGELNLMDPTGAGRMVSENYLKQARQVLEEALTAAPSDPVLRLQLAKVAFAMRDNHTAIEQYQALLSAAALAPPYASVAWDDLAIAYARTSRYVEEIAAYDHVLALESYPRFRSTVLANQAEAYMVLGDIRTAVAGYRVALDTLPPLFAHMNAPTTYWGLAVALDRSGDLDAALESIRLARTYDRNDSGLRSSGWFFVPPYDVHWYQALGHLQSARMGELLSSRLLAYREAVDAWQAFLDEADPEDPYLPVARSRLKVTLRERDAFQERHKTDLDHRAPPPPPVHLFRLPANPGP
jgi:tetratricopeptide (TPR) repeat protein